jgi:hypothetical protein
VTPYCRNVVGIDTLDHELDIWIEPDGSWRFKDEELLRSTDRLDAAGVAPVQATAERVTAELGAGGSWWSDDWKSWTPATAWPSPRLPVGWGDVPAAF